MPVSNFKSSRSASPHKRAVRGDSGALRDNTKEGRETRTRTPSCDLFFYISGSEHKNHFWQESESIGSF